MQKIRNKPLISIILPTCNRAHLINRAIESLIKQTYQKFEIIIVDDCSQDNTTQVIDEIKDKRIIYLRLDTQKGAAEARNVGIRKAKGNLIAFLDDDNEWVEDKLDKQLEILNISDENVGVVYSAFCKSVNGKKYRIDFPEITHKQGNIHKRLLINNFIDTSTALVKKTCFKKVGLFDGIMPPLEDWELWIRISESYEFKYINEELTLSHYTKGSISSSKDALVDARELIFQKHFLEIKEDKRLWAYHAYILGSEFHKRKDVDRGRMYILQAFLACPFRAKFLLAFLMSRLAPFGFKFFYELKKIIISKKNKKLGK